LEECLIYLQISDKSQKLRARKSTNISHFLPSKSVRDPINDVGVVTISFWRQLVRNPVMNQWLFLSVAIVSEVVATSALKASNGFTQLWPSLVVIAGYAIAFFFLSLTLRTMPVGVAYAIWSGVGIVLVTLIAWFVFKQSLDIPAIIGLTLIVAGVVVLQVFSKSSAH
jgi:small multidrug resistance pump